MQELPQTGDVLVSNTRATVEHVICIVPQPPQLSFPTHDQAVNRARELAARLGVDAWLTEDQTHFLKIASYRP
jgi:hypothetical protein